MIQRSTNLQESADVFQLLIYEDPAFIHPCWVFASFKIPRDRVARFVAANECDPTDQTALLHQRDSIPVELQSLPAADKRFYKRGRTTADLGFELLVDEDGRVRMFVSTPD